MPCFSPSLLRREGPPRSEIQFFASWGVWINFIVCKIRYFLSLVLVLRLNMEAASTATRQLNFTCHLLRWRFPLVGDVAYFHFTDKQKSLPLTMFTVCCSFCLSWIFTDSYRLERVQSAYVSHTKWHRIFCAKWLWPMSETLAWTITPHSLLVWREQQFILSNALVLPCILKISWNRRTGRNMWRFILGFFGVQGSRSLPWI